MSGAAGTISFTNIPPNIRIPLFYVQFDNSQAGANQTSQRVLLLGQTMLSQPFAPAYVPSPASAMGLYGPGSMLARMYKKYRLNDQFTEVQCLPLPDASGGTKATGGITFAGPATAAGTFPLYVAGQPVPFAVNVGDSATTLGANAVAAVTAGNSGAPGQMPCTAANSAGVVTLTANHKGIAGGALDISVAYRGIRNGEIVPAGVTYSITAFSGGATDPDLGGVAAALGKTTYDFIIHPYTGATQVGEISALLSDQSGRWSPLSQLFGGSFSAEVASSSSLLTLGATYNDQHTVIVGVPPSPTPGFEWAAAWGGAIVPALIADPARPLQTLPITGVLAPLVSNQFLPTTEQSLLTTGIALPAFDDTGNASVLRCVTTYQTNSSGVPDQSYLDAETLYTLMAITRQLKAAITQKFSRSKLADNGTTFGAGQPVVTPNIMKAEIAAQYAIMEDAGLVENAAAMTAATIVKRNASDPSRMDILFAPYLISGLRIAAVLNQFRLSAA